MESSADGRMHTPRPPSMGSRPGAGGLAWFGGLIASIAASLIAAVLAVAAVVVVMAVMGGAVLALAGLALRARRRVAARPKDGEQILEARNIGGHSWVAYGWDQRP